MLCGALLTRIRKRALRFVFFQMRSVFCDTRHAGRDSIRLSISGELENSRVLQMRPYAAHGGMARDDPLMRRCAAAAATSFAFELYPVKLCRAVGKRT